MKEETSQTIELSRSMALHQAVARYSVGISRMVPTKSHEEVATRLTYSQARALETKVTDRLRAEEPQWAGCMCRSLATIQLINTADVARILGYGRDFSYEAAVKSVDGFLEVQRCRQDLSEVEAAGLREVMAAFLATCK